MLLNSDNYWLRISDSWFLELWRSTDWCSSCSKGGMWGLTSIITLLFCHWVCYEPPSITRNGVSAIHYSDLRFLIPESVKDNNFFERHSQTVCSHPALLNRWELTCADSAVCSMFHCRFCCSPNVLHNLHLLHWILIKISSCFAGNFLLQQAVKYTGFSLFCIFPENDSIGTCLQPQDLSQLRGFSVW